MWVLGLGVTVGARGVSRGRRSCREERSALESLNEQGEHELGSGSRSYERWLAQEWGCRKISELLMRDRPRRAYGGMVGCERYRYGAMPQPERGTIGTMG